jgi:leucyl-tRNA synthetase
MNNQDTDNKIIKTRYVPSDFESKWQEKWAEEGVYTFKEDPSKEKYYPLVEFPYPSGNLHIGHWFSFATADVHARMKRMQGYNVLFTNGFDAFGLPAENAAIKNHVHPKDWTMSNIETMTKQFSTMGSMIDWSHRVIACLPEYYKWNQWIFLKMYEKGLAYRGKALGNWCPVDQTVLANEHVENGKCWRCGTEVIQKEIEQWFLKITAYADQLEWPEHPSVDWPISVRVAQNQWIGRSEGVEIGFKIQDLGLKINVFTTALDTVYGVTFLVLAPEHKIVNEILKQVQDDKIKKEIERYVEESKKKSELDRKENKEKTGVFTGVYVVNPFNQEKVPVWIADYVLVNYGTGAVMAVPGHDQRDHEFAKKFDLPIKAVIKPSDTKEAHVEPDGFWDYQEIKTKFANESELFDSGEFSGLSSKESKQKMINWIEKTGIGVRFTNYHIHDWSVSRQRYWGTPVPMVHCQKDGLVPVPAEQLPVDLPYNVDFTPKGEPPLATAKDWMKTKCPKCGGDAERDPETLDTFFDSSWYYYRYLNPHYEEGPFPTDVAKRLMPVDIYFGGAEHTLGHTLYARFFTKFFKDLGLVDFDEFAKRRVQHGVILGPDGNRMSKSKGNVVNPDDVVAEYGADTVRMYLCFMMPYEATAPWDPKGIWGVYKFLKKVWDMQFSIQEGGSLASKDLYFMHTAIKKVGEDITATKFNTAVSALMIWLNHLSSKEKVTSEEYKNLILLVAPFAPHMAEEIWQKLYVIPASEPESRGIADLVRNDKFVSVHQQSWPLFDNNYLEAEEVVIAVQINGKTRSTHKVSSEKIANKAQIIEEVQAQENIARYLQQGSVKTVIYVPGKIVNFVVS